MAQTENILAITHPPAHGQLIHHEGKEYETVKEGLAYILTPKPSSNPSQGSSKASVKSQNKDKDNGPAQTVFYNPIQQFNRDLSVLAIKAYGEEAAAQKHELWEKRRRLFEQKGRVKKRKRGQEERGEKNSEAHGSKKAGNEEKGKNSSIGLATESNGFGEEPTQSQSNTKKANGETTSTVEGTKRYASDTLEPKNDVVTALADDQAGIDQGRNLNPSKGQLLSTSQLNGDLALQISANESIMTPATGNLSGNAEQPMTQVSRTTFSILDALSATGLRALRYAKELSFVTSVLANDMSQSATQTIELNIKHNNVSSKVFSHTGDARGVMYKVATSNVVKESGLQFGKFDVIDLDPYGTAAPFFDAAVQAVIDGGLLCITCTDAGVFASSGYPEKTYSLYGGLPLRGPASHEGGLRLILNSIASSAARYGFTIEPLLSLSIDFYARLFVRINRSPSETKFLSGKTMIVYNCDYGCGAWTTQLLGRNREQKAKNDDTFWKHSHSQGPTTAPNCEHCGSRMHVAGPMWAGPLHSAPFIQRILDSLPTLDVETYPTLARIEGMLSTAMEEDLDLQPSSFYPDPESPLPTTASAHAIRLRNVARVDQHPFFIIPNVLCKVIHCQTPDEDSLRGALRHLGYRVSRSHTKAGSIKTDAPWNVLWEIIREWARQKTPIREGVIKEGMPGWGILQKGRQIPGEDKFSALKTQLLTEIEKSLDVDSLRTVLEATLYRTEREANSQSNPGLSNGASPNVEDESDQPISKKIMVIPASKLEVKFDQKLGAQKNKKRLVRYQVNPRPDWGPMNKAKGAVA